MMEMELMEREDHGGGVRGSLEVSIYHPDRQVGWGLGVWREMVGELVRSRELTWRLFVRDFTARYKQSVLGILWALIIPTVTVGTFVLLNSSGVMNVGEVNMPYPVYALLGMTIWQLFAGGLGTCSNAIIAGGSMVIKINFPRETLVLAALGQAIADTLVRMGLLVVVFAIYGVVPQWTVIFFPFVMIPLLLLTLGLGLLFSLLGALIRDIPNIVSLATTFLLFLTPVLYPNPGEGVLGTLTAYNPLAALVTAARDVVVTGYLTQPAQYAWATTLSVVVFLISWRLFHMVEPRMAERV